MRPQRSAYIYEPLIEEKRSRLYNAYRSVEVVLIDEVSL